MNYPDHKKWDVVGSSIVIRIRANMPCKPMEFSVTYTTYPIRNFKKKWKQNLWLKWLKVRVWIGDLYK